MEILEAAPSVAEYLHLRSSSGLTPKRADQALPALVNSWAWVHIRVDDEAVSMGRVIGDGGWYFHIADMATLPQHQRRGFGGLILERLLHRIESTAPPGAWVTLLADPPGVALYEKFGFRPTAPGCMGMALST